MRVWGIALAILGMGLLAAPAAAHVSEQAFVLLLPTGHYIVGGCLSVLASILLISAAPTHATTQLFAAATLPVPTSPRALTTATSLLAFAFWVFLVWAGITGPRDPLTNALPLVFWTGFWIIFFSVVGLFGNAWVFINPWVGPYRLAILRLAGAPPLSMPACVGVWPALLVFIAFSAFHIADPAPADPDRLAMIVLAYALFTFAGMALVGDRAWLSQVEAFSVLFALLGRTAIIHPAPRPAIGCPGWGLTRDDLMPASAGVFALVILAGGSFDGLKETFWWLARIDVNPLEFPGRSAVLASSLWGLAAACILVPLAFAGIVWLGARLADRGRPPAEHIGFVSLFRGLAPAVLPIAVGYHTSHFLVAFLVDGQYLLAAIGDPLATGANLFGLGETRVTTGFLNTADSVRAIWLTQAALVVGGHVLSVLVSHHVALRLAGDRERAVVSQIPLAGFMICYTLFGLWLLAAPRGA